MQWVYCWKVCVLHYTLKCKYMMEHLSSGLFAAQLWKLKHSHPNIFSCNQSGNWCFSTSCSTWWCVISDFPALDCIFVLSVTLVLVLGCPLEQCRCWPGLPVSGAPVTASITAGSSAYPQHVTGTGHPIHSFKYLHVRRWMPCVNLDFSDISSVIGNYLCLCWVSSVCSGYFCLWIMLLLASFNRDRCWPTSTLLI